MTPQPVLVIPSLDPDGSLPGYVRELGALGLHDVVVVDDGSSPAARPVFDELASLPGCTVLEHRTNEGKGAALKTAFRYVLDTAPGRGVVTADADGQHAAADVAAVARALVAAPERPGRACVLGVRDFDPARMPWRSRLGNTLTSRVVRLLHGQTVSDTQTGLRAFTAGLLEDLLAIPGDRYEYEMSTLTWLLAHRVPVEQVPISAIYHDESNSQSHFRPVRDSVIVSTTIVRQAAGFAIASAIGAAVDLAAFTGIIDLGFGGGSGLAAVTTATIGARILSTLVNFALNKYLVFDAPRRTARQISRYYLLAVGLLAMSTLATTVLARLLDGHVVWAKIIVDGTLFVASYLVQKRWVFAHAP